MPKSKNRKNPNRQPPKSLQSPHDSQQPPEETGKDRIIELSALSARQQAVLPVLALSPSIAHAARQSGLSERTLRRWLDDPAFREQLSELHKESYELARRQLQALVPHFISVLAAEAIDNPDPAVRIRAARYAISYALKFSENDKLEDDLSEVRGHLRNNS